MNKELTIKELQDLSIKNSNHSYVEIDNELYYKIENSDAMRPFFMNIVSDSNHWMFISSNGGLTAGRKDSNNALFPYYTEDKITESAGTTGSKTLVIVRQNENNFLWEPFSKRTKANFQITRNLYKNRYGNKIIFEEVNYTFGITFRYQWNSSDTYGFVKKSSLINNNNFEVKLSLLDGIQNVMPYGVSADLQNQSSNLVDAYKRTELEANSGLGIFALSAIIVDKAEPSEALKANIVWSIGIENPTYLLSNLQLEDFRKGKTLISETDIKAEKGAYFIHKKINLSSYTQKDWLIIANVNQNHSAIASLIDKIKTNSLLYQDVLDDSNIGTQKLIKLIASSDALQLTADKARDTRHMANTLFNIMRGGVFDNNYQIEKWDFEKYLSSANKKVFKTSEKTLKTLPDIFDLTSLKKIGLESDDKNFRRLCLEYMPLKFSRRHGDPSRPWNKFSINTRNEIDGSKILDYEGNWRDIFQNWEALSTAFPEFIESMIHKFLNATTFDGYNPYRITKDGFDWEVIEENNPWSYIGYWGDHQIIYLLKFLESLENHKPDILQSFFDKDLFVYANVPYKIKPYKDLVKNPKDTIEFDYELDEKLNIKKQELGADGFLLRDENLFICKVNFIEKMLATILAKVSNFIPEAGIWLNTQRPEWNDANNALVGNGVSMVTLYYLRRFLSFFNKIVADAEPAQVEISNELLSYFNQVAKTLKDHDHILKRSIKDSERKIILDAVGQSASNYRTTIYKKAFSGRKSMLELSQLKTFIETTLNFIDHSIRANKRPDNLYHAYNLMTISNKNEIQISYLNEMLEGQVAALSAGYLTSAESLAVLNALKKSKLFRPDQYSYILYPNKELPSFLEKNVLPKETVESSELLVKMMQDGNTQIVEKDINGNYHFNGNFNNARVLKHTLESLKQSKYSRLIEKETPQLLQLFEMVFNHKEFTGRSGTFYGYEGLGSIYWHMVSKLQLAVQECCLKAIRENETPEVIGKLLEHYYEINEGIGVHKSPKLYGAFPTDPYSHTPAGKGAQQPGMTGQVKEDILSRFGELGVFVYEGKLLFYPCLLRKEEEFLKEAALFSFIDVHQNQQEIELAAGSLAFTYCQIPIVYTLSEKEALILSFVDGKTQNPTSLQLNNENSNKVFQRTGEIVKIDVHLTSKYLK
ncbi:MAG: hypothetical protein AUK33_00250 [Flavobacteriaceae bacterium CG2_30_34_30]|nr:MAG: hypothetical protein AUK33_00250 [Flavobacteriaceae bacterium CG2_30_34_30]